MRQYAELQQRLCGTQRNCREEYAAVCGSTSHEYAVLCGIAVGDYATVCGSSSDASSPSCGFRYMRFQIDGLILLAIETE